MTKNRYLVYSTPYSDQTVSTSQVYKVNLKVKGSVPQWIIGHGGPCSSSISVGINAKLAPLKCGSGGSGVIIPLPNADASKIWLTNYNAGTMWGHEYDAVQGKNLTTGDLAINNQGRHTCVPTDFDDNLYCKNWSAGREIYVFDTINAVWKTGGLIPYPLNDSGGILRTGMAPNYLLAFYSLNSIFVVNPILDGTWNYISIAG